MKELTRTGHATLLSYVLQQVQQFRSLGEGFMMQHADSEHLGEVEDDLLTAVLAHVPAERIVRDLSREERLRGLSPAEVLQGFTPEELAAGLSEEQAACLRQLLERKRGS